MNTQCKSCGSVKFEYKEGKKVCVYCGREVYDNSLEIAAIEDKLVQMKYQMDLDRQLLQFHGKYICWNGTAWVNLDSTPLS